MTCEVCRREMGQEQYPCPWCGQSPGAAPARSGRLDDFRDEALLEKTQGDLDARARRKRRLQGHALTGALTFFVLGILLGLPMSLRPGELLFNALISVVLGAPLGFAISWFNAGRLKGALISMGGFFILMVIEGLIRNDPGVSFNGLLGASFLRCPPGALPGWIIGLHVEVDD
jgi:hypothetical protein